MTTYGITSLTSGLRVSFGEQPQHTYRLRKFDRRCFPTVTQDPTSERWWCDPPDGAAHAVGGRVFSIHIGLRGDGQATLLCRPAGRRIEHRIRDLNLQQQLSAVDSKSPNPGWACVHAHAVGIRGKRNGICGRSELGVGLVCRGYESWRLNI